MAKVASLIQMQLTGDTIHTGSQWGERSNG